VGLVLVLLAYLELDEWRTYFLYDSFQPKWKRSLPKLVSTVLTVRNWNVRIEVYAWMMESLIGESYVNNSQNDLYVIRDVINGCKLIIGRSKLLVAEYIFCISIMSSEEIAASRGWFVLCIVSSVANGALSWEMYVICPSSLGWMLLGYLLLLAIGSGSGNLCLLSSIGLVFFWCFSSFSFFW